METRDLYQPCLLWAYAGDDQYGQPTVLPYVEIRVQWLTNRTQMLDHQGNSIQLDGALIVAQKVAPRSIMWLGAAAEWEGLGSGSGSGSGDVANELMEVKLYSQDPDIKGGRYSTKTVGLLRYRDSLPTIVGSDP